MVNNAHWAIFRGREGRGNLRSKSFRLFLCVLVLVNGARMAFSAKVRARAKSPTFAQPKSGHSHVRKTIRTYPMETLATQAMEGRRGGTAM